MSEHISITGIDGKKQPSLDIQTLRRLGLEAIIKTSSKYWTDYNEHDPGITILETLVYALTDLGYRSNFPITDILAQQQLSLQQLKETQFYTARNILTVNPLTLLDFRKLIVDIPEVKNAWIFPSQNSFEPTKGLLDIVIDSDLTPDSTKGKDLLQRVEAAFQRHRNLSQQIGKVSIRVPLAVRFQLHVNIPKDVIPEKAVASLLLALENYLSSTVYFLSFQEMMEEFNDDVNQVFDGPPLLHGFLPPKALLPRMTELRAVDLLPLIEQMEEINSIQTLTFRTTLDNLSQLDVLQEPKNWSHQRKIPTNRKPVLAPTDRQLITVYKNNLLQHWTVEGVERELTNMRSSRRMPKLAAAKRDISIPEGQYRDISSYISIQEDFPRIYGLQPHGHPPGASKERIAKTKQLKAYLLFFDQILANYLAQLANLGKLFSWSEEVSSTYFFQGLEDTVQHLSELLVGGTAAPVKTKDTSINVQTVLDNYRSTLHRLREDKNTFLLRRNLFLNHLLARFGRKLEVYTGQLAVNDLTPAQEISLQEEQMHTQLRLLENYPFLSAGRAKAFNLDRVSADFSRQFSGLRYWVETLFGMVPEDLNVFRFNDRFVAGHFDELSPDKNEASEFVIFQDGGGDINMPHLVQLAVDPANLQIEAKPINSKQEEIPYRIRIALNEAVTPIDSPTYKVDPIYTTAEQAEAAMARLTDLFQRYSKTSERVYLIEHLLLRPNVEELAFGLKIIDKSGAAWLTTKHWHSQNAFRGLEDMVQRGYVYYRIDDSEEAAQMKAKETTVSAETHPAPKDGSTTKPTVPSPAPKPVQGITPRLLFTLRKSNNKTDLRLLLQNTPLQLNPDSDQDSLSHVEDSSQRQMLNATSTQVAFYPTQEETNNADIVDRIEQWLFRLAPLSLRVITTSNGEFKLRLSFVAKEQVLVFNTMTSYKALIDLEKQINHWEITPSQVEFEVYKQKKGTFTVLLAYQTRKVSFRFTATTSFTTKAQAQKNAQEWQLEWQKNIAKTYPLGKCWQPFLQPWDSTPPNKSEAQHFHQIFHDPYSFILTIVVPKWPVRFQSKSFRDSLLKTLHHEAPAHLWLNVLWLDKISFQEFQQLYGNWWRAFKNDDPTQGFYKRTLLDFVLSHSFRKEN